MRPSSEPAELSVLCFDAMGAEMSRFTHTIYLILTSDVHLSGGFYVNDPVLYKLYARVPLQRGHTV